MLGCVPGALAHLGWRPVLITGAIRQIVIRHFADLANVEDPSLSDEGPGQAVWRDGNATGILIEGVHRWLPDLVDKFPAVLIKRNSYKNVRITIGDRVGMDAQGFDEYNTLWVGSHTVFCVGGNDAGAEALATEVQRELTEFGPAFVRQLNLMRFQVTDVDAAGILEGSRQSFVVPVNVGWAYQEQWKLREEELPLAGFTFETLLRGM